MKWQKKIGTVVLFVVLAAMLLAAVGCEVEPTPVSPLPTPVSPLAVPAAETPGASGIGDVTDLLDIVDQFLQDARVYAILALIGLDLVLGIAAAIKKEVFAWRLVGQFYQTMVVPYILGYLALYVAFEVLPGGLLGDLVGDGLATVAFGVIVANLVGSVWEHLGELGLKKQPPDEVYGPAAEDVTSTNWGSRA